MGAGPSLASSVVTRGVLGAHRVILLYGPGIAGSRAPEEPTLWRTSTRGERQYGSASQEELYGDYRQVSRLEQGTPHQHRPLGALMLWSYGQGQTTTSWASIERSAGVETSQHEVALHKICPECATSLFNTKVESCCNRSSTEPNTAGFVP